MRPLKLEIEGLHKSFPQSPLQAPLKVLDGIDLEIDAGEFLALIGPSGCGKTTLLNVLAGLIPYDAGEIRLDGQVVTSCQGRIAYMQQKDLLLLWRTVLENALLGLEIQRFPKRESRRRARELLARFGLKGFEDAYPAQLSGGMRQRVALVRTLLLEKPIWLLDEPFGALDAMTRAHLHRYLLEAWQEAQATVLFVTHDIEEALGLADRIAVLTARPARVKGIVPVKLERPRDVVDPSFVELKSQLLMLLTAEEGVTLTHAH